MYGQEERTYRRYAPQAELMNPAARDLNGSSVQLSHVSLSTPSFFTFNLPRSPSLRSLPLSVSLAAKWLNSPVSFWMQFKDQTLWSHGCGMHWQHTHTYTILRSTDIDVQKTSEFYVYALNLASSSALTIRLEGDNCNCCIKSSWQAMNRVLKARI